ncbi:hypothetical protein DB32_007215 [Sandaracinus amylolyticus]|uniref:DUF4375 domain-containing protein n=1 Tax=Sandaracinus amylolyticus TaxID=927083 RepID=A0A0F6YN66_9BACT|nr:hypothetical protein DB32_007215 [Sandaracinus amylolyticus]
MARDIAYFFHEQAEYGFLFDDLEHWMFETPYWLYLALDERDEHVERGCLALAYAMGCCEAGGVGIALGERLAECRAAIVAFTPHGDDLARLRDAALEALELAATPNETRDSDRLTALVSRETEWIHGAVVRRYFEEHAARILHAVGSK